MAGKCSNLTNPRLFRTLDALSKNTFIELAVDRAYAELGEDATDEQVTDLIGRWLVPVFHARGDRVKCPTDIMHRNDAHDDAYRQRMTAEGHTLPLTAAATLTTGN